jgi:uncharacterized protein
MPINWWLLGTRDGSAMAGHHDAAHARPTLEVIVTEGPTHPQPNFCVPIK